MPAPTAADLDPILPEPLRVEAAAWAAAADAPVPEGPDSTAFSFQPDPAWETAEEAFIETFSEAYPDLELEGRGDIVRLLPAFGSFDSGDPHPGGRGHARLCWLCVNAIRTVLHCWDGIAENPEARDHLSALADVLRGDWFLNGEGDEPDWAPLTEAAVAIRDGVKVNDCDACRVEPVASAVAHAARFARDGDSTDAAACLADVGVSADEGCWWHDPANPESAPEAFAPWFARHVLPAAWRCEELPPTEPGEPVWRVVA
ncbi:hypothetical protein [Alienimonas chondri]|uniref:Uncharacterized protein n=1 Tax=Alienimonas chondri TaxID=2681879 RepID=A0ABX1VFW0_9PLAN|nr:hypothetical protein [Alienimonas chondri]NNJ27009.1 hypothetical protein [Alienimonas chondri]